MHQIPKSHPRAESLLVRHRLVEGFDGGLVAKEGLIAQGRGEAFDYLLGEKTVRAARRATRAAAAQILLAHYPVISVNGNVAALCPKSMVRLAKRSGAELEVNLFYSSESRKRAIARVLRKNGASRVLGVSKRSLVRLSGTDSARRMVDKDGIMSADVVVVPLEDGDRTLALRRSKKRVIAFDLNPLSRTAQTADITIVDNIVRAADALTSEIRKMSAKSDRALERILEGFDNRENLQECIVQIRDGLARRAHIA